MLYETIAVSLLAVAGAPAARPSRLRRSPLVDRARCFRINQQKKDCSQSTIHGNSGLFAQRLVMESS